MGCPVQGQLPARVASTIETVTERL